MGQGRNALSLASKGWHVTATTWRTRGLALRTVKASHAEFDYRIAKGNLVVEAFAFTDLGDAAYPRKSPTGACRRRRSCGWRR